MYSKQIIMNDYEKMMERHQKRFETWAEKHIFYAFDEKQFTAGMIFLGLDPEKDIDKIYRTPGNAYYKRVDAPILHKIVNENWQEFEDAMDADPTGDGFIYQAFYTELNNHEYSYTGDPTDALESLNLDRETVQNDPRLLHGLKKAEKAILEKLS